MKTFQEICKRSSTIYQRGIRPCDLEYRIIWDLSHTGEALNAAKGNRIHGEWLSENESERNSERPMIIWMEDYLPFAADWSQSVLAIIRQQTIMNMTEMLQLIDVRLFERHLKLNFRRAEWMHCCRDVDLGGVTGSWLVVGAGLSADLIAACLISRVCQRDGLLCGRFWSEGVLRLLLSNVVCRAVFPES